MVSNRRLKAKAIKHHKENLYHLETGIDFEYTYSSEVLVKKRNNKWVTVSIRGTDCVFCKNLGCGMCPIMKITGAVGCVNTPWEDISEAIISEDVQAIIKAEKVEIAFLESLEV